MFFLVLGAEELVDGRFEIKAILTVLDTWIFGLLVKMGDENSWNAFIYLPLHHLLFI